MTASALGRLGWIGLPGWYTYAYKTQCLQTLIFRAELRFREHFEMLNNTANSFGLVQYGAMLGWKQNMPRTGSSLVAIINEIVSSQQDVSLSSAHIMHISFSRQGQDSVKQKDQSSSHVLGPHATQSWSKVLAEGFGILRVQKACKSYKIKDSAGNPACYFATSRPAGWPNSGRPAGWP